MHLIAKNFLTYGVRGLWGKVLAGFLLLAPPLCAEEMTVLALGDSLVQGFGLPEADGFVPQMQAWLRDRGAEVTIINAGVSGDTTAGGAARVDWGLTPGVDAMIVALGANDMLRGIDPGASRANLSKVLAVAREKEVDVLLIGLRAPGNLGADYKAEFDAIYPGLAEEYGVMLAPDFFAGLEGVAAADLPFYFQPDRLHPNADGVARIVEGLGPHLLALIAAD